MFSKRTKWIRLAVSKEELMESIPESGLKKLTVDGKIICLVHYQNKFYAMRDRCPHQSASLSEGSCSADGFVVCPWHHYGFDVRNGRGPGYFTDTFEIMEKADGIFIGIKKGWLEI
jgi:nitrite reductase/ring-hydroxylating ferredoxin subunit